MESALMISPPNLSASLIPTTVLPIPVGPQITIIFGLLETECIEIMLNMSIRRAKLEYQVENTLVHIFLPTENPQALLQRMGTRYFLSDFLCVKSKYRKEVNRESLLSFKNLAGLSPLPFKAQFDVKPVINSRR
jgi:hypothetical protein